MIVKFKIDRKEKKIGIKGLKLWQLKQKKIPN
jgi:hypothetical protein